MEKRGFKMPNQKFRDRQAAQNFNVLLTNAEKAQLTHCPYCATAYAHAFSEVDADNICRVTCGYCESIIEYQIEFVGGD